MPNDFVTRKLVVIQQSKSSFIDTTINFIQSRQLNNRTISDNSSSLYKLTGAGFPNSLDSSGKLRDNPIPLVDLITAMLFHLRNNFNGDWITITDQNLLSNLTEVIHPTKAKNILGREFLHGIFDARVGFNLEAFAILAGTLIENSLLILILPNDLTSWHDNDSLRWNENQYSIQVPNFCMHLLANLKQYNIAITPYDEFMKQVIVQKTDNVNNNNLIIKKVINDDNNVSQRLIEQQQLLNNLLHSRQFVLVVTAKRGRGKSAIAGQLSHYYDCIVTAPNKFSLTTFFQFASSNTQFYPPDDLANNQAIKLKQWLIIDEGAMIPIPILVKLITRAYEQNCRILITSTVEGYEGTGQGFLLKLLQDRSLFANFMLASQIDLFSLEQPIRWQSDDRLESFVDALLLNQQEKFNINESPILTKLHFSPVSANDIDHLKQVFYLLKSAHYRTTPVDLRRLFDAENQIIWQATNHHHLVGAAILIAEGKLSEQLINDVWLGTRRPKGNLVAQSLVAHAGEKRAAQLSSYRINRIAVLANYRRHNIAKKLVEHLYKQAESDKKDFLSVSFAYTKDILTFWLACGFQIVHIGSHKEATSGNYSLMAIKAISLAGQQLLFQLQKKLQRNWYWFKELIDLELSIKADTNQVLNQQDIDELKGFALYHRPFEASYAALCRLYQLVLRDDNHNEIRLLSLIATHTRQNNLIQNEMRLLGKAQFMKLLKLEVKACLANFD